MKTAKKKLKLASETVRKLTDRELAQAGGALGGDNISIYRVACTRPLSDGCYDTSTCP